MGIKDLKPQLIWSYFDEITRVPRPSKEGGKNTSLSARFCKKTQFDGTYRCYRKCTYL